MDNGIFRLPAHQNLFDQDEKQEVAIAVRYSYGCGAQIEYLHLDCN